MAKGKNTPRLKKLKNGNLSLINPSIPRVKKGNIIPKPNTTCRLVYWRFHKKDNFSKIRKVTHFMHFIQRQIGTHTQKKDYV